MRNTGGYDTATHVCDNCREARWMSDKRTWVEVRRWVEILRRWGDTKQNKVMEMYVLLHTNWSHLLSMFASTTFLYSHTDWQEARCGKRSTLVYIAQTSIHTTVCSDFFPKVEISASLFSTNNDLRAATLGHFRKHAHSFRSNLRILSKSHTTLFWRVAATLHFRSMYLLY